jgi:hypothetical protein
LLELGTQACALRVNPRMPIPRSDIRHAAQTVVIEFVQLDSLTATFGLVYRHGHFTPAATDSVQLVRFTEPQPTRTIDLAWHRSAARRRGAGSSVARRGPP